MITPLWDKIVLKDIEGERITSGGIIIPATVTKGTAKQYEVIAVGEGPIQDGKLIDHRVKVGDVVVDQDGSKITIDTKDGRYYMCREVDCIATIPKE